MEDFHLQRPLNVVGPAPNGNTRALFKCRLPRRHHREFLNELASLPEVKELKELAQ
jgi:hypothetical protein